MAVVRFVPEFIHHNLRGVMMAAIKRVEDLESWQRARALVREVYGIVGRSKLGKDFAIRNQLCRAVLSGMSNIAEGFARHTDRDFAHFLDMARGSFCEAQSLLYVALDVGYLAEEEFHHLHGMAGETIRMITRLTAYLRKCEETKKSERQHSRAQAQPPGASNRR
jgi:four helix bundle protein